MGLQFSRRCHNEIVSDDENLDSDSSTSESACVSEVSSEDDNISLSSSSDSDVDTEDSDLLDVGEVTSEEDTVAPSDELTMQGEDDNTSSNEESKSNPVFTFKLCGDNIDKTVKRRYMRSDKSNVSLHYFHACAILDRVDDSGLEDTVLPTCLPSPQSIARTILPSSNDDKMLHRNFTILVSRVLAKYLDFFSYSCNDAVQWHIVHKFSSEMSKKSIVVSSHF